MYQCATCTGPEGCLYPPRPHRGCCVRVCLSTWSDAHAPCMAHMVYITRRLPRVLQPAPTWLCPPPTPPHAYAYAHPARRPMIPNPNLRPSPWGGAFATGSRSTALVGGGCRARPPGAAAPLAVQRHHVAGARPGWPALRQRAGHAEQRAGGPLGRRPARRACCPAPSAAAAARAGRWRARHLHHHPGAHAAAASHPSGRAVGREHGCNAC